jgi:hypothetical protein
VSASEVSRHKSAIRQKCLSLKLKSNRQAVKTVLIDESKKSN